MGKMDGLKGQQARVAERIARETEKIRKLQETQRRIERRLRQAEKMRDRKEAIRLGTDLIKVLREVAPGFFDDNGQFDGPLLVGALIDAHAKLTRGETAAKWTVAGEAHFAKPTPSEPTPAAPTAEAPAVEVDANGQPLPSIDELFNTK